MSRLSETPTAIEYQIEQAYRALDTIRKEQEAIRTKQGERWAVRMRSLIEDEYTAMNHIEDLESLRGFTNTGEWNASHRETHAAGW